MNEWIISIIIGSIVLVITVPALLWLRFGKRGKKMFSDNIMSSDILKVIKTKQNNIKAIQKKIEANSKILKDEVDIFYITKLKEQNKVYSKDIDRLKREINNLENSK